MQDYLKVCLAANNRDDEWLAINYEFAMNYSIESLRKGYAEFMEERKKKTSNELLRELGYTEDDIAKSNR